MPVVSQAERRAVDSRSDFDAVTRLIKVEFARFEQERVKDFQATLKSYLEETLEEQRVVGHGYFFLIILPF